MYLRTLLDCTQLPESLHPAFYPLALVCQQSQILTAFLSVMFSLHHNRTTTMWFFSLAGLIHALRGFSSLLGTFPPNLGSLVLWDTGFLYLHFLPLPEEMLLVPFIF